jgi:hypothetical protein
MNSEIIAPFSSIISAGTMGSISWIVAYPFFSYKKNTTKQILWECQILDKRRDKKMALRARAAYGSSIVSSTK